MTIKHTNKNISAEKESVVVDASLNENNILVLSKKNFYNNTTSTSNITLPAGGGSGEVNIPDISTLLDQKATEIEANDDIDDYKTPGFYYSYTGTRTHTLSGDIPSEMTDEPFSLWVFGSRMADSPAGNSLHQLLSSYNMDKELFFLRTYDDTNDSWGNWIEISNALNKKAIEIPRNGNINNYKEPGFYYSYSHDKTITLLGDIPEGVIKGFSLWVFGSRMNEEPYDNFVHQMLSTYDKNNEQFFIRTYSSVSHSWGDWVEIYTSFSNLKEHSVFNEMIVDRTINANEKIAKKTVTGVELADGSVHTNHLADDNITRRKLTDEFNKFIDGKMDTAAKKIEENTDLNDIYINGFYSCSGVSVAETLQNYPPSLKPHGFGLIVMNNVSSEKLSNVNQLLLTFVSTEQKYFVRSYDNYAKKWSLWSELTVITQYELVQSFTEDGILVNVYSDEKNIYVTIDGSLTQEETELLNYIKKDYRPYIAQTKPFFTQNGFSYAKISESGIINIFSPDFLDYISCSLMYPRPDNISTNIILEKERDMVDDTQNVQLKAMIPNNVSGATVEFYDEYTPALLLSSPFDKTIQELDSTTFKIKNVDAKDNSLVFLPNKNIEIYEEYNDNISTMTIRKPGMVFNDDTTITVIVTNDNGDRIPYADIELYYEPLVIRPGVPDI